uniref:hypothetical protein n=1 Tax=Flavobacterium sp. TaxID=239 RepID=UPI00404B0B9D
MPIVYQDLRKAKKWYLEINNELGEDFKLKVNGEFDYTENIQNITRKNTGN